MNTGLPVYFPNAPVCRMSLYECCTRRINCSLYPICAQIQKQTVCKRDCPTCDYDGCSLPADLRRSDPVYIENLIQSDRLPLDLEGQRDREQIAHRTQHKKLYDYYNNLFGDRRARRNRQCRERYWRDPDYYRQLARESYRRRYVPHPKKLDQRFQPECKFRCDACPYPDCILPADWRRKAYAEDFAKRNPDYFRQYRLEHSEERKAYNRQYHAEHREECREYRRAHRQKPEVKAQRAAYDKAYRQTPAGRETERRKKAKYRATHKNQINEAKRAYYNAHKAEINARRREKRNGSGTSTADPAHSEM